MLQLHADRSTSYPPQELTCQPSLAGGSPWQVVFFLHGRVWGCHQCWLPRPLGTGESIYPAHELWPQVCTQAAANRPFQTRVFSEVCSGLLHNIK